MFKGYPRGSIVQEGYPGGVLKMKLSADIQGGCTENENIRGYPGGLY